MPRYFRQQLAVVGQAGHEFPGFLVVLGEQPESPLLFFRLPRTQLRPRLEAHAVQHILVARRRKYLIALGKVVVPRHMGFPQLQKFLQAARNTPRIAMVQPVVGVCPATQDVMELQKVDDAGALRRHRDADGAGDIAGDEPAAHGVVDIDRLRGAGRGQRVI